MLITARGIGRTASTAGFHTSARSQTRSRPWVHTKKRPQRDQLPASWKQFEVPEVVLDLDSWGNDYTRPFDRAEQKAQAQKWKNPRIEATRKRIEKFEQDRDRVRSRFAQINEGFFAQWRVTDIDLMVAALKGPPDHKRRPSAQQSSVGFQGTLSTVANKNAIPLSTFRHNESFLNWLLHRKPEVNSLAPPTLRQVLYFVHVTARKQDSFKDLQRYLSYLLRFGHQGFKLVHECNAMIAELLFKFLQQPGREHVAVDFLPFLNSLYFHHRRNGKPLGVRLCHACLVVAACARQLQAMENYYNHGLKEGYWTQKKFEDVVGEDVLLSMLRHLSGPTTSRVIHVRRGANTHQTPSRTLSRQTQFSEEAALQLLNSAAGSDTISRYWNVYEELRSIS
ncbi:hypothetical protein CCHL11_09217 [Colletotrichum chlorophyti]|uniref:Uncharacterized protein n=1 Tax=Colletotrichum chlorophyti TaxID=708187 RepID=A0A1Q8RN91_9PEZI|nr:hypothetical protein CCHL11_09217 [Colletotrichum chlorophyti]